MLYDLIWIHQQKVGNHHAKSVLIYLAMHKFDEIFFKVEHIAGVLEISIRTVQRSLKFLSDNNFIKVISRYNEFGKQVSSVYEINTPSEFKKKEAEKLPKPTPENDSDPAAKTVQDSSPRVTNRHPHPDYWSPSPPPTPYNINNKNIIKDKSTCASENAQDQFLSFWYLYPKKKNKKQAEKAWVKIKTEQRQIIFEKLLDQKKFDPQYDGGQYTPMASTYLNGERWNDELPKQQLGVTANGNNQFQSSGKFNGLNSLFAEKLQRSANRIS